MLLVIEILGIITMFAVIFMLVWGSIILVQILNQLRYKNYLMEKLTQHMYTLAKKEHDTYNSTQDE